MLIINKLIFNTNIWTKILLHWFCLQLKENNTREASDGTGLTLTLALSESISTSYSSMKSMVKYPHLPAQFPKEF